MNTMTIRPFSTGCQAGDWIASNCNRCKKSEANTNQNIKSNNYCEIESALLTAEYGDGYIPDDIAKRMGYNPKSYVWQCLEVDWTEEWKAEISVKRQIHPVKSSEQDCQNKEPKTHVLKTINPFFYLAWHGFKPFDVRKNDRDFKVGDKIVLQQTWKLTETGEIDNNVLEDYQEIIEDMKKLDGHSIEGIITCIYTSSEFIPLPKDYVILTYREIGRKNYTPSKERT